MENLDSRWKFSRNEKTGNGNGLSRFQEKNKNWIETTGLVEVQKKINWMDFMEIQKKVNWMGLMGIQKKGKLDI